MPKKLSLAKAFAAIAVSGAAVYTVVVTLPAQQIFDSPPANFTAPEVTDTAGLEGPRQPIFYRHDVHAGQYRMDCRYCHFSVEIAPTPGLPTLETCMNCHLLAGAQLPEVQKVQQAFNSGDGVEWVEVHKLPPFVHFPHMRHVRADPPVRCQECHGPIQEMVQVYQYSPMKMGWCLDCHKQRGVSIDCTVCHY
jgi:hypothetical protein